ncbi:MAG: hypothetical protein ABH834_04445, partial [Candidatus Altiarchaeota archaeon]
VLVLFSAIIILSSIAHAQGMGDDIKITVKTDKPSYNPGDFMRVSVNVTNVGGQEILTKELHAKVISKSWFGLTAHDESKSYSRNFVPGKNRFGYVEVPIPRYTPLGRYEIQIWATYGTPTGSRQIVEEGDIDGKAGIAQVEVNLGIVFLLSALILLGLIAYAISHIMGKSGRRPPTPRRRPTPNTPKATDVRIEYAIIVALILCIAISLVYVGYTKKEKETFSVIYVKPGSYINYVEDNTFALTYGVECHEKFPTKYQLVFYVGDKMLEQKNIELCKQGAKSIRSIEESVIFHIPSDTVYPAKFRIVLKSWDTDYENHIWLRGVKPEE